MSTRPSWDDYFLSLLPAIGSRATCDRGKSGCVVVRERRILVTGYVGSPAGLPHCDEVGHLLKKVEHGDGRITTHCLRTVHAEQNAICQAARYGISLEGTTLYCTMTPCRTCAALILNVGIRRVVAGSRYHDATDTIEMFSQGGVELVHRDEKILEYGSSGGDSRADQASV